MGEWLKGTQPREIAKRGDRPSPFSLLIYLFPPLSENPVIGNLIIQIMPVAKIN